MTVVFVGPSLSGLSLAGISLSGRPAGTESFPDLGSELQSGIEFRPPAMQGDIMRAVQDGATVIGLIDGQFEHVAPVWHKEILYALKVGVCMFGASSMGALRAVECQAFGMRGLGRIFEDYASGRRFDDADVALLYAPAELGYAPVTLPLVNVDATLETASQKGLIDEALLIALQQSARRIHYKDRTWKGLAQVSGIAWPRLQEIVDRCWTDQKQVDALALIETVARGVADNTRSKAAWSFNATPLWRELYG